MTEKTESKSPVPVKEAVEVGIRKAGGVEVPFTPQNINDAYYIAKLLSASGLVPTPLKGKPNDVLVILMTGHEFGMTAMQSLRSLHVIEGRASMSAAMMMARCVSHPDVCEYLMLKHSDDKKATYVTKRKGHPDEIEMSFTVEQAAAANLLNKTNWKTYKQDMLRWRCGTAICRAVYPDLVEGIIIHDEEEEIIAAISGEEARTQEISARIKERAKGAKLDPSKEVEAEDDDLPPHDSETGELTEREYDPAESQAADAALAEEREPGSDDEDHDAIDTMPKQQTLGGIKK